MSSPSSIEQKLIQAIAERRPCDFSQGTTANDPQDSSQWGPDRTIPGALLRKVLLDGAALTDQPLEIIGARIEGILDLRAASVPRPVYFLRCAFPDTIDCTDARMKTTSLEECVVSEFQGRYTQIDGSLLLRKSHFSASLYLESATVARDLDMRGSQLSSTSPIWGNQLTVGGSVYFRDAFSSEAVILLESAQIKSSLDCFGGTFRSSNGSAVFLNSARIDGFCIFSQATIATKAGVALSAEGLQVGGFLSFVGAQITGCLYLRGARIGANLNLAGVRIDNPGKVAMDLERARISGHVLLHPREVADPASGPATRVPASISGTLKLLTASIEGALILREATIEQPEKESAVILAEGVQIGKFLNMARVNIKGAIMLRDAQIGGSANFSGAKIDNAGETALDMERARISGDVFIRPFEQPKSSSPTEPALVTGGIVMTAATIGGSLNIHDDAIRNVKAESLLFNRLNVSGVFRFANIICGNGRLSLANAKVAALSDNDTTWPERGSLLLNGFDYGSLSGGASTSWKTRLEWLRRFDPDPFNPQPYTTLAAVLRRAGHDQDARKIAIARHTDARRDMTIGSPRWLGNVLMGATCGHGYRPWRAAMWAMAFMLIGWFVFNLDDADRIPLKDSAASTWQKSRTLPDGYPPFKPFLYSADLLLPIVNLQQKDYWAPNSLKSAGALARSYIPLHVLAGWFFTTLFVAGVSGLIRRD